MKGALPSFAFTPNEANALKDGVGRNDIAVNAFIVDCEDCLHAFEYASTGPMRDGMPGPVAERLRMMVAAVADLRSALYGLPEDIKMLIDLHLLSEGSRRRIAQDISQIVEPLEDLADGIVEIEKQALREVANGRGRLEDRLVLALAGAYRNRLNCKPSAEEESGFPQTLAAILDFAGQRLPSVAACRGAITPSRLRRLMTPTP
jgi:hypothetical protein